VYTAVMFEDDRGSLTSLFFQAMRIL